MLNGSNDPWMFHQANTRNYDGAGHSLLSDLLDDTFAKYGAVMTFPIVSPTMDDLAGRVRNRMALDASGVVATIGSGGLTITVAHAATIPVTGLCTPGAESYGAQTISYLVLADGQTANYALTGCMGSTGGGPDTGAPDPGNAGAGGAAGTSGGTGGSGSVDAGGMPSGTAVNGGSSTHVGLTSSAPMTPGCACAVGDGGPDAFVTVLCLDGVRDRGAPTPRAYGLTPRGFGRAERRGHARAPNGSERPRGDRGFAWHAFCSLSARRKWTRRR